MANEIQFILPYVTLGVDAVLCHHQDCKCNSCCYVFNEIRPATQCLLVAAYFAGPVKMLLYHSIQPRFCNIALAVHWPSWIYEHPTITKPRWYVSSDETADRPRDDHSEKMLRHASYISLWFTTLHYIKLHYISIPVCDVILSELVCNALCWLRRFEEHTHDVSLVLGLYSYTVAHYNATWGVCETN